MKTTWVLTEEERKQKFEGRGKRKGSTSEPTEREQLAEEELSRVEALVRDNDYWEQSKVDDFDEFLIRQIIRMVAFGASLTTQVCLLLHHLRRARSSCWG